MIIQLGDALSHDVTLVGAMKFAGLFVPIWLTWTAFTFYNNRFVIDGQVWGGSLVGTTREQEQDQSQQGDNQSSSHLVHHCTEPLRGSRPTPGASETAAAVGPFRIVGLTKK